MINGETSSGFAYSIHESAFDDMRLVDELAAVIDNDDPLAVSRITLLLLGKEQRDALYAHLQREDGTVPPAAVVREIAEILKAKAKNS